jgi:hypothetical protein
MFREPHKSNLPQPNAIKRPALFWTVLAGMLILLALVVPKEWTNTFSGLLGEEQNPKVGAWSDRVDRIDARLRAGEPIDLSDEEMRELLPHLQVRRLYGAGPLNVEDAREAEALFRDFNRRIAGQELEGSRDALRNERNKQLAEALPRLEREELDAAMAKLHRQLEASGAL